FRVHILSALGDLALSEIIRDRVKQFVAELRKKSVMPTRKKQTEESGEITADRKAEPLRALSKETIRNIVAVLRADLSEAVESNLIDANPAVKLGKFYKEAADFHEEIDPFTAGEVSTLLEITRDHNGFENYVLMLTLFHCGLRKRKDSVYKVTEKPSHHWI